jgi:hypothetical protein
VGIVGGVFLGAGWYFSEMAGKFPKKGFLSSYSDYMSVKSDDDRFRKPFNFGTHIGGLPWLGVFAVTYPIRAGVVAVADLASRPSPPKPKVQPPEVAQHEAIAKTYGMLKKEAEADLARVQGDRTLADLRRERYLDDFIAGRPDLVELLQARGPVEARARAEKILDAWRASRREKGRIAAAVAGDVREKDARIRAAAREVGFFGMFADAELAGVEDRLDSLERGAPLPGAAGEALARERTWLERVNGVKSLAEYSGDVKSLADSWRDAKGEGKSFLDWAGEAEPSEKIVRLELKLATSLKKTGKFAPAVGNVTPVIDASYALATKVAFAGQVEAGRALLSKMATERVFEDGIADEWSRIDAPAEAARVREARARAKVEGYERKMKESQADADRYRRK